MVRAHFFDINVLLDIDSQAWVVSKKNPNVPIMKISKSNFNLIKSGIYRKQENKIEFNGHVFWLPTKMMNALKIKAKRNKIDFSQLAISLQEFINSEIIENLDYNINLDIISELKNSTDDIYIICSKQNKRNYEPIISKIQEKLIEEGLLIKDFYYINENFLNQNDDEVKIKEMRLLLQHLLGYKTENNKFIDKEVERYDQVFFYDNNLDTLKVCDDINNLLETILSKTDNGLRDVIKEDIVDFRPTLFVNKINDNLYNRKETKKVIINLSTLIQKFESFEFYNRY